MRWSTSALACVFVATGGVAIASELANSLYQVAEQDLKMLADDAMLGRKTGEPGATLARQYLAKRFAEIGIRPFLSSPDYFYPFSYQQGWQEYQGVNVHGYLPACDAKAPWVVISAHYDHLGGSGRKVFNGADDNASGVAGILFLAGQLAASQQCLPANYAFLATDAEESGLKGARAWLVNSPIKVQQTVLNINLDMISHLVKKRLYLVGNYQRDELKQWLKANPQPINIRVGEPQSAAGQGSLVGRRNWRQASDHGAFYNAGIAFWYFGNDVHEDYHTVNDDWQKVDWPRYFDGLTSIWHLVQWQQQQLISAPAAQ